MRFPSRGLTYFFAGTAVILGAGLVGYVLTTRRPAETVSCRETILDPDPDRPPTLSGSLHLQVCSHLDEVTYNLFITDYLRRPPVIGGILGGTIDHRGTQGLDQVRAHWVGRDTLRVEYPPDLRITWELAAIGPVRVFFLARPPGR